MSFGLMMIIVGIIVGVALGALLSALYGIINDNGRCWLIGKELASISLLLFFLFVIVIESRGVKML